LLRRPFLLFGRSAASWDLASPIQDSRHRSAATLSFIALITAATVLVAPHLFSSATDFVAFPSSRCVADCPIRGDFRVSSLRPIRGRLGIIVADSGFASAIRGDFFVPFRPRLLPPRRDCYRR